MNQEPPSSSLSTEQLIEDLHGVFPWARERISTGTSEKAEIGREFSEHFSDLPKIMRAVGMEKPSEEDEAALREIVLSSQSRREMLGRLQVQTRNILGPLCMEYTKLLAKGPGNAKHVPEKFLEYRARFQKRIAKVRPHVEGKGETPEEREHDVMNQIIVGGVSNVAYVSWSFFDVIPRVPKEDGTLPNASECEVYARSVQRIIMSLISSQDDINHILSTTLTRRDPVIEDIGRIYTKAGEEGLRKVGFGWGAYHPEDFRYEGTRLEIRPYIFQVARRYFDALLKQGNITVDEPRVGCAGAVIIPALHQWCKDAANRVLFSHIDRLRELPRDEYLQ